MTFPVLTVSTPGPLLGSTFELSRPEMVVGRRSDTDIVLEDDYVSRRHAVLRTRPDGVWVEDLGSTGGTFVDGQQISAPTRLSDGSVVRFGSVDAVFRAGVPDAAPAPPPPPPPPSPSPPPPPAPPAPVPAAGRSVARGGSIICLECGTKNPPGTMFCTNCGAFLEFYGERGPKSVRAPMPGVPGAIPGAAAGAAAGAAGGGGSGG
ncbi:MAG: FHA domain-containing protein, partial [Actinomycetota bacterium]|nr:FHA domain-containing protein [Actinomycetota bacterium]